MDIGELFDEIFEAAKDFGEKVKNLRQILRAAGARQAKKLSTRTAAMVPMALMQAHGLKRIQVIMSIIIRAIPIHQRMYT